MPTYSGFFNAVGHDRRYNATHFSWFFDGLIKDGVYVNWPERDANGNLIPDTEKGLHVSQGTGLSVNVAPGRSWFNRIWLYNDATLALTLDATQTSLVNRIDAIVIDVNTGDDARIADIIVVKGTEGVTPDKPSLINTATRHQYPLAYVSVRGSDGVISNIEDCILSGETPAVEALLEYSSRSKKILQDQIDAKTFPNLANALVTEDTEIDSDNDYMITQKVANNTAGDYVRKKMSNVVSWFRKKLSSEKGITYDQATGKFKLTLKSETALSVACKASQTVPTDHQYPVVLDKDGYPCVNVPWTDNNTNNKVTQTEAPSTENTNYPILLSNSNNIGTETEGVKKAGLASYNPSTKTLNSLYIQAGNTISTVFLETDRLTIGDKYADGISQETEDLYSTNKNLATAGLVKKAITELLGDGGLLKTAIVTGTFGQMSGYSTAGLNINVTVPSNYKLLGILSCELTTTVGVVALANFTSSITLVQVYAANVTNNVIPSGNVTATCRVLFIKYQ